MTIAHDRYRQYLETLTLETLPSLPSFVCSNVRFKDPFNDVSGVSSMSKIFQDMFENIGNTVFRVDHMASDKNICLMAWHVQATLRGKPWNFSGASIITFAPDGMVEKHIDYWDAASDFYKHFPIIGWLLEKLKLRVTVN
jgi:steroid delta-isomerase